MESNLVCIDEVCSHCGVRLYMELSGSFAHDGFDCAECRGGLRWIESVRARAAAYASFMLGSMFALVTGGTVILMSVSASVLLVNEAWDVYPVVVSIVCVLSVVVSGFVSRWVWRSQQPLIGVLRGRRLIPAKRVGDGPYRYNLAPTPIKLKRAHQGEELGGALSMDQSGEQTKGGLSMESSPGDE